MKSPCRRFPLYPLGFALFSPLFLYAHNFSQVRFASFAAVTALCLAISGILYGLFFMVGGKPHRAALLVFLFEIFIFFYGRLHDAALGWAVDRWLALEPLNHERFVITTSRNAHAVLLAAGAVLLVAITAAVLRSRKSFETVSKPLGAGVACLLFLAAAPALSQLFTRHSPAAAPSAPSETVQAAYSGPKPDIYYIILDGYTRADKLRKAYLYDNSRFVGALESLGFYVAPQSHSNYAHTELSLPSSLNMRYLAGDVDPSRAPEENQRTVYHLIEDNELVRFLKSRGYRYVHMDSIWGATMKNRFADVEIRYSKSALRDEFFRIFAGTTILKALESRITSDLAETHLYNFEKMSGIASVPGPKFVFAHFLLPHNPYVFGRQGQIKERVTALNQWDSLKTHDWRDTTAYIDQLEFTSTKTLEMVKAILKNSERPPVIVVQGDHGFNLVYANNSEPGKETRLSILNAYYLPEKGREKLYETITPVNSFRLICNHYLGGNFEMLEDKSYFSGPGTPYDLEPARVSAPAKKI